jgi:hypothetical protein
VNVAIGGLAVVALVGLFIVEDDAAGRFIGFWVIVGAVTGLYTLNFLWPRGPELRVEFHNTHTGRTEVWQGEPLTNIRVVVVNDGGGPAEAVEVRFGWNESGNSPNPDTLDVMVNPPRFIGRDRVLEPGDEWRIALLVQLRPLKNAPRLRWWARAKGMRERQGVVQFQMVHPPTG